MKSIKVCEYSRSKSFYDDFILQDQASGELSQDQWSSGFYVKVGFAGVYISQTCVFLMRGYSCIMRNHELCVFDQSSISKKLNDHREKIEI